LPVFSSVGGCLTINSWWNGGVRRVITGMGVQTLTDLVEKWNVVYGRVSPKGKGTRPAETGGLYCPCTVTYSIGTRPSRERGMWS
jgi:hypothetical protein